MDNSLAQLPNSLKLEDFFVQFTWKEWCNYRAYLFIVFVVANPCVFLSETPLGLSYRLSLCILEESCVQSYRNSCAEKQWCLPCCRLLGYESDLWERASRKWMHECMGTKIISSYGHLGWGGVLTIEVRFPFLDRWSPLPPHHSPLPCNQFPLHASVALTAFVLLLSVFELTASMCERTIFFCLCWLIEGGQVNWPSFAYKPTYS